MVYIIVQKKLACAADEALFGLLKIINAQAFHEACKDVLVLDNCNTKS